MSIHKIRKTYQSGRLSFACLKLRKLTHFQGKELFTPAESERLGISASFILQELMQTKIVYSTIVSLLLKFR